MTFRKKLVFDAKRSASFLSEVIILGVALALL